MNETDEKLSEKVKKNKKPKELTLENRLTNSTYDIKNLKKFLRRLYERENKRKEKKKERDCTAEDNVEHRVDHEVKLRCRQLPQVVVELRKALMRQDWDEVVTLTLILCHPGLKYYSTIVLRVCFILLFTHPKSNTTLLKNFIRLTTNYILEEDVDKFIRILFALRKTALPPLESGKYVRKTGDYKIIRDAYFEGLI